MGWAVFSVLTFDQFIHVMRSSVFTISSFKHILELDASLAWLSNHSAGTDPFSAAHKFRSQFTLRNFTSLLYYNMRC